MTSMTRHVAVACTALAALAVATTASGGIFGPEPVAVSSRANAPSGSPAISGDNRVVRYVAFNSVASDLVPGDTNGAGDVFLYNRRTRAMTCVSVAAGGRPGQRASSHPAVDRADPNAPRWVAF